MKDYYKILEVLPTANAAEIKKAYRRLAFKYHPDKNKGDKLFENKFKELLEAYETLSNTSKRQAYDHNYNHQRRSSTQSSTYQRAQPFSGSQQKKKTNTEFAKVYFINHSKDFILLRWKFNDTEWQFKNSPVGQTDAGDLKWCVENGKFVYIGDVPCKKILNLQFVLFDSVSKREFAFDITNTFAIRTTDSIVIAYAGNKLEQYIKGKGNSSSFRKETLSKEDEALLNNYFYYESQTNKELTMIIATVVLFTAVLLFTAFHVHDSFISYVLISIVLSFVFFGLLEKFSKIVMKRTQDPAAAKKYEEKIKAQQLIKAFFKITKIIEPSRDFLYMEIFVFSEIDRSTMKFYITSLDYIAIQWNTNDTLYMEYFNDCYLIKTIKYKDTYVNLMHTTLRQEY